MNNHNQIAATALATRIFLLLAMSISCAILPDFDPGGDVLRFHLRLDDSSSCFCAKGHACDSFVISLDQRSYDENSRMELWNRAVKWSQHPFIVWNCSQIEAKGRTRLSFKFSSSFSYSPSLFGRHPFWHDVKLGNQWGSHWASNFGEQAMF